MLIEFDQIPVKIVPNMRGGEKEVAVRMFQDENGKIMRGMLIPGATLGMHTHEDSSEVIYILSGAGKVLYDGGEEPLEAGSCHYCPKGHAHSLMNTGAENMEFLAVIPNQ